MNLEIFERTDSRGRNALMLATRDIFRKGSKVVNVLLNSIFMRPEVLERIDIKGRNAVNMAILKL